MSSPEGSRVIFKNQSEFRADLASNMILCRNDTHREANKGTAQQTSQVSPYPTHVRSLTMHCLHACHHASQGFRTKHGRACLKMSPSLTPTAWARPGMCNSWTCDAFLKTPLSCSSSCEHGYCLSTSYRLLSSSCSPHSRCQAPTPAMPPLRSAIFRCNSPSRCSSSSNSIERLRCSKFSAAASAGTTANSIQQQKRRSRIPSALSTRDERSSKNTERPSVTPTKQQRQQQQQQQQEQYSEQRDALTQDGTMSYAKQLQQQQQQRHETPSRRQKGWSSIRRGVWGCVNTRA